MGDAALVHLAGARGEYARLLLARLVDDIRRVERQYPVWDCGLADMCSLGPSHVAIDSIGPSPEETAPVEPAALESQLTVLDVTRQLGLVPFHEYRTQRREIMRRLRMTRLAHAPVLAHVIDLGISVADGYEDGIRALAGMTERVHRWRLGEPE